MNKALLDRLCATCELGTPRAEPQVVTGGLLHRLWCLITDRGTYALKQLNPAIISRPGIQEKYRLSEQIAADIAAHGIPAIAARSCAGETLHEIDGAAFLIYDWVEGEVLPTGPATPASAQQIGSILARIHTLHLSYSELGSLQWKHFHDEDWDILTFQAADLKLPWAYPVRALLPQLLEWSHWYEQAGSVLGQTLVVSHRDLDPKNVLWRAPDDPWLLDWEAAGLINPTMELVGVALDWCGQTTSGTARVDSFVAVLEGYTKAGGVIHDPALSALHGFLGTLLGWLLFNMRRSLGESVASAEEQQLGTSETTTTLARLRSFVEHIHTWATLLDQWR